MTRRTSLISERIILIIYIYIYIYVHTYIHIYHCMSDVWGVQGVVRTFSKGVCHVLLGQFVCHWASSGTQFSPVAPHSYRM